MLKVMQVSSDTNIGGAGKCILTFLKFVDKNKFDIPVVLPKDSLLKEGCKSLGARVVEIDAMRDKSLDIKAIKELIKVFRAEKPDIVHAHASMSAKIAAKLCGIKVIYTRHSVFEPSPKISKGIGKLISGFANNFTADKIIAVAEAAKDNLLKTGVDEKKIIVLLNGVEPLKKLSEEEIGKAKDKFGIKDEVVVSIVARLNPVKGHKYFVEAAKKVKEKGLNVKFLIAGTGEAEESIRAQIKELKLEDTVIMLGFLDNVQELMNITDIQANCSFGTEATSLSLLEGMSLGVPAVVTEFGGNPGVIKNGRNGFLVPINNSDALAEKIAELIENKELYEKMHAESLLIYKEKFTAEVYARNIESVYTQIGEKTHGKKD